MRAPPGRRHGGGRGASTLELFFDLVFVFAITQVTGFLREHPTAGGLGRGALLLAMLWWTWSQYTWTTNWTGTERLDIRLLLLAAMGVSLVMSEGVGEAFGDRAAGFAVPYLLVRLAAGATYWLGTRDHPGQRAALLTFLPLATLAPALVVVGAFVGGDGQTWIWVVAIGIDLAGAASAGRGTWELDAEHFADRNGLFVIIALGESIVAMGVGALETELDAREISALSVAFVGAAALWWSYFDWAAPLCEQHLERSEHKERGRFARDGYTLLLYPVVLGIVLYAVAAEEVTAHPDEALDGYARLALVAGISLVLLGFGSSVWRAVGRFPTARLATALVVLVVVAIGRDLEATWLTGATAAVVVLGLAAERARLPRVLVVPRA